MNRFHQWCCKSDQWARKVKDHLLPWALKDVDLGEKALEIGPGYGVTTRLLADRVGDLTALEVDPALAARLRPRLPKVDVVHGDGAAMPFSEGSFSSAVCFTMLHHVPSAELQDRLFTEAHRVLAPGGVFAGSDSRPSARFRLIHLFDTMVLVDPDTLATRLETAGFVNVEIATTPAALRFRARRPDSS